MYDPDGLQSVWRAIHGVVVAAIFGGMARAFTALHDGLQNGRRVFVEVGFGAVLGVVGAAVYAHIEPTIELLTWPTWLKIAAAGAVFGGLGPVLVRAAGEWVKRKGAG